MQTVAILGVTTPAPSARDGKTERINIGWNTTQDPDGKNEDLGFVRAQLELAQIGDDPVAQRTAARELVAFTQGIEASSAPASGISRSATADAFSAGDIAAMQLMSGCRGAATATVVQGL